MSILVVQLPARSRLAALTPPVESGAATEYAYVLSPDGLAVGPHGRCAPALLPKAESVVVVLADSDVSWHRITVPRAPAARLRSALAGVLEEALLTDTESLHFALAPAAGGGQSAWVAAIDKAWFAGHLAALERGGTSVERAVPSSWPEDTPMGHFSAAFGANASAPMQLTWSDAQGVTALGVNGSLARTLLPQWSAQPARWTAHPAVAAPAERWLGASVLVQSDDQRALQAARSLWNLRQFDLAPRHRGSLALRDALRRFSSPRWRPVRRGLVALAVLQVVGLNLWAWHQSNAIDAKRQAMVSLLRSTHPQVRAVLDAPLQMQREADSLRAAAGRSGEADLETLLAAAASAWPEGQPALQTLRFEAGKLSLSAPGWSEEQIAQFRAQLAGWGWSVDASNGALTLARAGAAS